MVCCRPGCNADATLHIYDGDPTDRDYTGMSYCTFGHLAEGARSVALVLGALSDHDEIPAEALGERPDLPSLT